MTETASKTSRTAKVFALSLGASLAMLGSIVFSMVAARYLSKHDYATIRQTFLAYEFITPLLLLGLPNALYYFLPRSENDRRGLLIDNITLLFFAGAIFSLFILLGGHTFLASRFNNPDLQKTLPWLVVYPLLTMPVAGMAATLVFAERVRTLSIYTTISSLLIAIAGIVGVLATQSYEPPIITRIVVPAIFLPVALFLMFKAVPGAFRMPCWTSMTSMIRYAVPLGLASMLGTLTMQIHALIVAAICSPEDFAVYINGAIEIPVIGIITGSITTVVFAEMSAKCANGKKEEALHIFSESGVKSACILLPTMFFFLVAADPFIVVLYSEEYRASVVPFMLYLLLLPIRIVVYGAALMALGMTKEILIRSIFDLFFNAVVCYFLVTTFGYTGAAASLVITLYFWSTPFNIWRISRGFGVTWYNVIPFRKVFHITSLCIISLPLAIASVHWQPNLPPLARLVTAALLYLPCVGYLLYRSGYISIPKAIEDSLPTPIKRS